MSYILAIQPAMLSQAGMSGGAVFTATALTAAIATIFMGVFSNLPIALAAGMGLNAMFVYSLVLGSGYSWQGALALFLCEGILALILAFTNVRTIVSKAVPDPLKKAIPVGIGAFIALIGFTNGGLLAGDTGTIIGLKSLENN
jgi:AGZA family xanthine/uracil permease-like MFS transporter